MTWSSSTVLITRQCRQTCHYRLHVTFSMWFWCEPIWSVSMQLWPWIFHCWSRWSITVRVAVYQMSKRDNSLHRCCTWSELYTILHSIIAKFNRFFFRLFLFLPECAIHVIGTCWMFCQTISCYNMADTVSHMIFEGETFDVSQQIILNYKTRTFSLFPPMCAQVQLSFIGSFSGWKSSGNSLAEN